MEFLLLPLNLVLHLLVSLLLHSLRSHIWLDHLTCDVVVVYLYEETLHLFSHQCIQLFELLLPKNVFDNLDSSIISLDISWTILFFILSSPLWWGVLVIYNCLLILCFSQNSLNSLDMNYLHLSYIKHLIFKSISF